MMSIVSMVQFMRINIHCRSPATTSMLIPIGVIPWPWVEARTGLDSNSNIMTCFVFFDAWVCVCMFVLVCVKGVMKISGMLSGPSHLRFVNVISWLWLNMIQRRSKPFSDSKRFLGTYSTASRGPRANGIIYIYI